MPDAHRPAETSRTSATLVGLLAVVTALTAQLVSMSGPFIDRAFTAGVVPAAATAVGTYAAAGLLLVALAARRPVDGRLLVFAVVSLVVARLATQGLTGDLRYGIGLATVALSVAVLVLVAAVVGRVSGRAVSAGVTSGLGLAAALNLTLGTWDSVWRAGLLGWAPTVVLGLLAVGLAWRLRGLQAAPAVRGLWLLGPFLGLAIMTWANPAFISSQSGLPLWSSAVVVVVTAGTSVLLVSQPVSAAPRLPGWADGGLVVLLGAATAGVFFAPQWPQRPGPLATSVVLLGILVLACVVPLVLARALTRPVHTQRPLRLAGAASCAGLGIILPLLVYQLDYDVPLGVPNALVPVAVAVLVAGLAVRSRRRARLFASEVTLTTAPVPLGWQVPALGSIVALALVGLAVAMPPSPHEAVDAAPGRVRVIDWNLHYGVSSAPAVDLDAVAAVIRESGADVATLQEVSRGWVMGGGADMAEYLAQALGMQYVFVPAADQQFGNVVMWKSYLGDAVDVQRVALPYGDGPQQRSAVVATLDAHGVPVTVASVHLQHRAENTDTRLEQLLTLLTRSPLDGPTILAGDLNAEPGWPEPLLLAEAGLVSAQDVAGDPTQTTFPSDLPTERIDWVFGWQVAFSDVEVIDTAVSDHRPVVATVEVGP